MIINNTYSINSLVAILNFNYIIYIISQIFNNGVFIFNTLPFNNTDNNTLNLEKCISDYRIININSSITICISFIYFIYKCHYIRINYYSVLQFILLLGLNLGFSIFNIIYYYEFFDRNSFKKM